MWWEFMILELTGYVKGIILIFYFLHAFSFYMRSCLLIVETLCVAVEPSYC